MVSERGEEGIARVRELTGGFGVQPVLECVGTAQAMDTAMGIVRPGGAVGRVGVPHYASINGAQQMFYDNVSVGGRPRRHLLTSTSFFPTCSKAASTLTGSSTARSISTACPTAIAR